VPSRPCPSARSERYNWWARARPGTGGDRFHDGFQVQPSPIGIEEPLADADHVGGNQRLVDHLGVLPGAGSTLVDDRLAHRLPTRIERDHDVRLAADHDRQPCLPGTNVAAGDGRVDAVCAPRGGRLGNLDRQRRLARGHVDDDVALAASGQHALGTEDHTTNIGRESDDRKDHVRGLGHCLRAVGPLGSPIEQRPGLFLRTVVYGGGKTGLDQMPAHARTHHPRADPSDPSRSGRDLRYAHASLPVFVVRSRKRLYGAKPQAAACHHSEPKT
jgi:hypothetical protein